MFLEKCGKAFFSQIRPLFFFILLVSPILGALFFLMQKSALLQDLEVRFGKAARIERLAMEKKGRKERFLFRHSGADPYFLDRKIESFPLLQKEKKQCDALLNHPALPERGAFQERLAFINENRLSFKEEKIETSDEMKEVKEHQRLPVQMDETDLKEILTLIEDLPREEGVKENHLPHLLITDFRLKKINSPLYFDVFEVEMDLIKREFNSQ